uniref:LOW QUALITY PROTEIN: uncharacterized protein LOC105052511 n=1 Tax=Elaeis guineensis var. tenera TaxID=51953 RepID=A0A6I9S186_ELAGV|nr:LOW QUALITY PROTEIN: uncharacterized protein LOC105052511 [Elaeis guineensis]
MTHHELGLGIHPSPLPLLSLSPSSLQTRARRLQPQASSFLPSPRRRTKRPNRLRPKLPKTLIPPSQSPPQPPPRPLPPPPPDEPAAAHPVVVVVEGEVEAIEGVVRAAEGVHPFPPAGHRWFPGPVLDLAFRFAALLAVQTVVAVWFLGGESVEDSRGREEQGRKARKVENVADETVEEFERMMLEIRAMAKEARENERKDLAEGNRVKEEVGRGLDRVRKSFAQVILDENSSSSSSSSKGRDGKRSGGKSNEKRKPGLLSSIAKTTDVPKGFSGSKGKDESVNGGTGGIQQIAHQNPVKEPSALEEQGKKRARCSAMTNKFAEVEGDTVSSTQGTERLEKDHGSSSSRTRNTTSNPDYIEGDLSLEVSSSTNAAYRSRSHTQADISKEASLMENKSMLEMQNNESSTKANGKSSIVNRNIKKKAGLDSQTKQVEHKSVLKKDKDRQIDEGYNPWWLKLPYVLAIFLHRGSDGNGPKGLYTLRMNSSSDDGDSTSYTVAFQDRGDATNFCYLVESFFEELGDVSADIVPLTIQELDEAARAGELKLIVVRKGQLDLYAGQPLVEAETALRSLLD